jgi:uncharacterized protein (TIGR02145 family)
MKNIILILVLSIGFNWNSFSQSVTIGKQIWMANNLDVSTFRNGDKIPEAKTEEEWTQAGEEGKPIWSNYPHDSTDSEDHGKLYNWYAVNDPRGLAPTGWKIPSENDWNSLVLFLGGDNLAGIKMKSKNGWYDSGNGTNESGFDGLPSGYRSDNYEGGIGAFYSGGEIGGWWCSTIVEINDFAEAQYLQLYYGSKEAGLNICFKADGYSVRCLKE